MTSYEWQRIHALEAAAQDHVAIIETMRAFLEDLRDAGLRADPTPTMSVREDMYGQWMRYLQRIDRMLRQRAKDLLRDLDQLAERYPRGNRGFGFTVRKFIATNGHESWSVALPHQCDQWGITNENCDWEGISQRAAIRTLDAFIADAQDARRRLVTGTPDRTEAVYPIEGGD